MTINATKDPQPDAKPDVAIETPSPGKTLPGLGVSHATSEADLEASIKVRRAELVAKLRELRMDTRLEATEAADKLKARLSEVAHIIKEGVVDGWASLGDNVKLKLEHWLADAKRQLSKPDAPSPTAQS
jgi:hypothetical protein